ncbi:hypothetical protein [Flavobacterium sp. 3HN19-14]|uniref:hypothetical protein n=1 Tax=Flavobacterium sp. 3HN19-14 TaxID=3448133 RepID=UPI003EE03032
MKTIVHAFLLLFSVYGFSQINYEPGYFINNQGVRKDCLIKNLDWKNNPSEILYRFTQDGDTQTAKVAEIAEFGVGEESFYKRFKFNVDVSGVSLYDMSHKKEPIWEEQTALLKVITKGDVYLYKYENSDLVRYFISVSPHDKVEQLIYKQYLKDESVIYENNYFRQQLLLILTPGQSTTRDFDKLKYTEKDITALIAKYSTSATGQLTYKDLSGQHGESVINFKAVASASLVNFNYQENNSSYSFSESKPALGFGVEVEAVFPFNKNKWSFFAAPNYQVMSKIEGNEGNNSYSVSYNFIEIPAGVRHHFFLNKKLRLFADAGYRLAIPTGSAISFQGLNLEIQNAFRSFCGFWH